MTRSILFEAFLHGFREVTQESPLLFSPRRPRAPDAKLRSRCVNSHGNWWVERSATHQPGTRT